MSYFFIYLESSTFINFCKILLQLKPQNQYKGDCENIIRFQRFKLDSLKSKGIRREFQNFSIQINGIYNYNFILFLKVFNAFNKSCWMVVDFIVSFVCYFGEFCILQNSLKPKRYITKYLHILFLKVSFYLKNLVK